MIFILLFELWCDLHIIVLVVSGSNVGDMFIWMPKEHLYVLVYLVTVMHSMQAGYMDKAQKYTDKALMQIEKLKSKYRCLGWYHSYVLTYCNYLVSYS